MKNKITFIVTVILTCLFCSLGTPIFAQSSKEINWERMQRDLDIMEGILDELFASPSGFALAVPGVRKSRGIYLDNYGVVFQINIGGLHVFDLVEAQIQGELQEAKRNLAKAERMTPESKRKEVIVVQMDTTSDFDQTSESKAQRLESLKNKSVQFLGEYADAIGQLKPDDRVTLLINFDNSHSVPTAVFRSSRTRAIGVEEFPQDIEVIAQKQDIIDYRKGAIDETAFRKHIDFREHSDKQRNDKNIQIMASILNTALSSGYQDDFRSARNHGLYLQDLGALFFVKGDILSEQDMLTYKHWVDEYLTDADKHEKKISGSVKKSIVEFKNEIVELIGNYGHTLRTIKPDEYVVVMIEMTTRWRLPEVNLPKHIILKVKKRELEAYDRGALTLAQLREKVAFQEY